MVGTPLAGVLGRGCGWGMGRERSPGSLNKKSGIKLGPAIVPAKRSDNWNERGFAWAAKSHANHGGNGAMNQGMARNQSGNVPPMTLPTTVVTNPSTIFKLKRGGRSAGSLLRVRKGALITRKKEN